MRKTSLAILAAVSSLALAACSEQAQDHAEKTAEAVGSDVENAMADATSAADESASAISQAADKSVDAVGAAADKTAASAARAAGDLGRKVETEAAKVEDRTRGTATSAP